MSTDTTYRRILRRETHSSRSGIAVTLAVLLVLVFAWIGTEAVLAAVGTAPLLVAPADAASAVLGAAGAPVGALTAVGAVVAIIGLVLIIAPPVRTAPPPWSTTGSSPAPSPARPASPATCTPTG
jgi:hypothetical protein